MFRTAKTIRDLCEICRYWSEMVAGFEGSGPVKAMCLSNGPRRNTYTTGKDSCPAWKENTLGAIDDPTCPGYDDEYPEDNCSMPFSGSMERKA